MYGHYSAKVRSEDYLGMMSPNLNIAGVCIGSIGLWTSRRRTMAREDRMKLMLNAWE
jgi:hypothetical protein